MVDVLRENACWNLLFLTACEKKFFKIQEVARWGGAIQAAI